MESRSVKAGSADAARSVNSRTASDSARHVEVGDGDLDTARPANRDRWAGQGPQLEDRLAWDGQGLAAGREDVQARRAREQSFGEPCDTVDEVLGVVEQEQHLLVGDERRDGRERRDAGDLRCAERARDLGRDLRGVAERRQLGEPHAVRVAVDEPAGGLEHQPGLAGPARADERHQPVTLDERRDLGELLSRPTKLVSWTGRFERRVLSERSGGKPRSRSPTTTW